MPPYHIEKKDDNQQKEDVGVVVMVDTLAVVYRGYCVVGAYKICSFKSLKYVEKINKQQEIFCFKFGGQDKTPLEAVA
jgi:hypothetical protein